MKQKARLNRPGRARVRQVLEAILHHNPQRVYLFGSHARGEADEFSDIDVVMVADSELPFLERMREAAIALPPAVGAVDLLYYTPQEWERMLAKGNVFAEMVLEEGELLYERP